MSDAIFRMVAGMWWFFTLIMISSYTANLVRILASVTNFDTKVSQIVSAFWATLNYITL